ncbi:MAG TPA: NYN domain-containing protein [Pilimelia sp.]|nr:NYN domain-containing protein [Pilimelia sp.]
MQRVRAYVDGFNLYHGMHAKYRRAYHWLDLERLAKCLLRRGQRLDRVKYFTARVRRNDDSRLRQVSYLDALTAHCGRLEIIEGRFQEKACVCFACRAQWVTYEEKESDVSLAVALVEDAALDHFDVAVVVSADSDLCPAVRAVKRIAPRKRIVAAFPPRRHSADLQQHVDHLLRIDRQMLMRSQLPSKVVTAGGIELTRPEHWT